MEAASAPSSKVTVRYTDPSKVIQAFESKFHGRTPLRSLHWKSPSRPLRSIPSLDVALVQSEEAQNGPSTNARRHEIPGLRETAYVKLYLLRCDDKETYKEISRKEIKQWIKDNTLEKESKISLRNQDHHDAFEWMIVHVVLPNTAAASQPKSSKHISLEMADSTDSVNSKSKWTGKSPSTIYDKLRADFSSSKSAVPRVAQVRITEQGKPTAPLSSADIEEQWVDFVDGLKACILNSFSLRVAQYEEDIREREAQRSLPGWNFCTFFVLKEGLARGFEVIGLLEDALGVYDELEAGLDLLLKDGGSKDEVDSTGGLLPYSQDLKAKLRQALEGLENDSATKTTQESEIHLEEVLASPPANHPFDLQRRQYRDLILANQVSALDLRIYIFTRRMELLRARANSSYAGSSAIRAGPYPKDLNLLADLMEQSLEFITSASRALRADLTEAYGGRLAGKDLILQTIIVGNMVSSWTWFAIMQMLAIGSPILDFYNNPDSMISNGSLHDLSLSQTHELDADGSQTPSERDLSSTTSSPQRKPVAHPEVFPPSNGGVDLQDSPAINGRRPPRGIDRLAAWTAELILLARVVVEELQSCQPWAAEFCALEISAIHAVERKLGRAPTTGESRSDDGSVCGKRSPPPDHESLRSLDPPALKFAASNQSNFYIVYDILSQMAYKFLTLSGGLRAAQQVLLDVASLAFSRGETDAAAQSLRKLLSLRPGEQGCQIQPYALALYAKCLKPLDRPEAYIQCLLECLQCPPLGQSPTTAQPYLDEFFKTAPLTKASTIPLHLFIEFSGLSRSISHSEDPGSFRLSLMLRSRVAATFTIPSPLTLVLKAAEKQEPAEIVLGSSKGMEISPTGTTILFTSSVLTCGWFDIHRLETKIGELCLTSSAQDMGRGHCMDHMNLSHPDTEPPAIFVYPCSDAPGLELLPSHDLLPGESRRLSLTILNPKRPISDCVLRLRAGTAGLRLRLHDASVLHDTSRIEVLRGSDSTSLRVPGIEAHQSVTIQMPYTLENASDVSVLVKCELSYMVEGEKYALYEACTADILLPVSVNVQDIYRTSHWFSRFHISPSTLVPIVILGCMLEDDPDIVVEESNTFNDPSIVFPHQPANWSVRLRSLKTENAKMQQNVKLTVRYQCLDEVVLNSLKTAFTVDLNEAGFSEYSRPLISHLIQSVKAKWTEQDLEVAGLTREMDIWNKEDLNWPSLLCGFDRSTKEGLDLWLTEWHRTRGPLGLDFSTAPIRSLELAVELPPQPPVVTTSLLVLNGISSAGVATLGQPLVCKLSIERPISPEVENVETELVFELFAHADAWLIGGRKKGICLANQVSMHCQVVLFPQRVGLILLPMIDVRCRQRERNTINSTWLDIPIEIYNRTVSTTVNVSPNLKSTDINIGSDDATQIGAGILVAIEPRRDG